MTEIKQPGRLAARRVVVWAALMMAASLSAMAFVTLRAFDAAVEPELAKRSRLIGVTVREEIERALDLGIPMGAIAGMDRYLAEVLENFEEIDRVAVLTNDGAVVAEVERAKEAVPSMAARMASMGASDREAVSLPMLRRNTMVGEIRLEVSPNFIRTRLEDVLLDVFVVGLVAVLLAFELVIWVMGSAIGKPLDRVIHLLRRQADGVFDAVIRAPDAGNLRRIARRLSDRAVHLAELSKGAVRPAAVSQPYFVDIRLPLFLFSTATEISGAFLPLYARDAGGPTWLSGDMAATAPLIAYLAAIALVAPFGGSIARRISPRTMFLASIPLTAMAMIGVGAGQTALTIALWHGAMALVYAVATIACQEYSVRTAPRGEDAQALGSYLFVVLGGAFCGSALGGVLADRIGASETFFVGAGLVLVAGGIGAATLLPRVLERPPAGGDLAALLPASSARVLLQPSFVALAIGVAAPVNIGMSVFIWYLTPVVLEAQGASVADIGRVVMIYYLVPVLLGPTVAKLADGRVGYVPLLFAGTAVSGVALTSLALWSGFWPMVAAVALFGLGHVLCDATQYAQAIRIAERTGRRNAMQASLGALRLTERLAAIAGLFASALLVEDFGHLNAIVAIGLLMLAGAALLLAVEGGGSLISRGRRNKLRARSGR